MTTADIKSRNFTFCVAMLNNNPNGEWGGSHSFVVPTPHIAEARRMAADYLKARGKDVREVCFYPRNYVRDATALVAEDRYYGAPILAPSLPAPREQEQAR